MKKRTVRNYMPPLPANDDSWTGPSYPFAVLVCAIGFFIHLLLSEQTLNVLGIPYGQDGGNALVKIHPGNIFIFASLFILILSHGNPFAHLLRIARQQAAAFTLLLVYVLIVIYWIIRGPKGVGLMLDTHMVMPICVIVFSYAPRAWCRFIVGLFASVAVVNSAMGIFESVTHIRLMPFDPTWEVLQQNYFRASALLGHPLVNAAFTAIAIFVVLDMRLALPLKLTSFILMLVSLVGFGGRSALGFCVLGLVILGIVEARKRFVAHRMTVMQLIAAALAVVIVPALCAALLYAVLHSGMGERLMAYSSLQDESADVRIESMRVFDYLSPSEIIFGVDGDRVSQIALNLGLTDPVSDIENPWILMFLFLGAIMFTLWFGALAVFLWRLMAGASPALKLAVIEYFVISSTSNSFGRKDQLFLLVPGIIICANRLNNMTKAPQD